VETAAVGAVTAAGGRAVGTAMAGEVAALATVGVWVSRVATPAGGPGTVVAGMAAAKMVAAAEAAAAAATAATAPG